MPSFTATIYDTPTQGTGYIVVSESGFSIKLTSALGQLKEFTEFWKKNEAGVWEPYINELSAAPYNPLTQPLGEQLADNFELEYAVSNDTLHLLGWSNAIPYSPLTYYNPETETIYEIESSPGMAQKTQTDQILSLQEQDNAILVTNCETGTRVPVNSEKISSQIEEGTLQFAVPVR